MKENYVYYAINTDLVSSHSCQRRRQLERISMSFNILEFNSTCYFFGLESFPPTFLYIYLENCYLFFKIQQIFCHILTLFPFCLQSWSCFILIMLHADLYFDTRQDVLYIFVFVRFLRVRTTPYHCFSGIQYSREDPSWLSINIYRIKHITANLLMSGL